MALNFPNNPTDGVLYMDPLTGNTYQWQVDAQSLTNQGKWTTRLRPNDATLNSQYLRLDASNGPILDELEFNSGIVLNSGTSEMFRTPPTRGTAGQVLTSLGNGQTAWQTP